MPKYSFILVKRIVTDALVEVEAETFQEAAAKMSELSQEPHKLNWGYDEYEPLPYTTLAAVMRDGESIEGFPSLGHKDGATWAGLNGALDMDDMPEELENFKE